MGRLREKGFVRTLLTVLFGLGLVVSAITLLPSAAAQTGTVLAGPFFPTGPTGNGRGIAFDGTDLYYTIVSDPNIYRINTAGVLQATIIVPAGDPRVSRGGPLAWDGTHLWTVDYPNVAGPQTMYRVDPSTGATAFSCVVGVVNPGHPALPGLVAPDGLHWTGTQLVLSGEIAAFGRPTAVAFMNPDCTITSFFTSPAGQGGAWSGVAFDGGTLWHADPIGSIIEQTDRAGVKTGVSFPTSFSQEDLEFDAVTFAPKCALWGNQATSFGRNHITAWEIPCVIPATFLLIDEDSIDNGHAPNFLSDTDVNDHIAEIGLRTQLPFFAANLGRNIVLHTGEVGDEGWFAPKRTPASWAAAGPTLDGLRNYVLAGPGLGSPDADGDHEALLDKVPDMTPLRATGLKALEGQEVCAVVYDSDIGISYDPLEGSLMGANLGIVAFKVLSVTDLTGSSSTSLPQVLVEILDAAVFCGGSLELFTDAPEPTSSSEPFDVSVEEKEVKEEDG